MLLKCGSWSKKIEVVKASNGDEISVNLISSDYGKNMAKQLTMENPTFKHLTYPHYVPVWSAINV